MNQSDILDNTVFENQEFNDTQVKNNTYEEIKDNYKSD